MLSYENTILVGTTLSLPSTRNSDGEETWEREVQKEIKDGQTKVSVDSTLLLFRFVIRL